MKPTTGQAPTIQKNSPAMRLSPAMMVMITARPSRLSERLGRSVTLQLGLLSLLLSTVAA